MGKNDGCINRLMNERKGMVVGSIVKEGFRRPRTLSNIDDEMKNYKNYFA